MARRFERALRNMDRNAWDADGKWRLSTPARMEYAFWDSLFAGAAGWVLLAVCGAAVTALLIWLFA